MTTVQEHPVRTQVVASAGEPDVTSAQAAAAASSARVRTMMSSVKLSVHVLIDTICSTHRRAAL
jgi:hypothetical protein